MAQYDYSRTLATARRLIDRYGRTVALQGAASAGDPTNPLAGPGPKPAPIVGIRAAFVQPSSQQLLGLSVKNTELFSQCSQMCLIAPMQSTDYDEMKFLIDSDGRNWKINVIEKLKPGPVTVLYYMGLVSP